MTKDTVLKTLDLFFAFNNTNYNGSVIVECNSYDDKYFRWDRDSFKHKESLTVIYNNSRIVMFNTKKVRDRLGANMDKIQSSKDKVNFGCDFGLVKDLVSIMTVSPFTDDDRDTFKEVKECVHSINRTQEEQEGGNCRLCNKPYK
jgi:hypothetical protein